MKKGFAALGLMLAGFLVATVPAAAQSVDDKIKALEQELTSLKSQQMELKKEATAAAAALPSFSYRPGNGVNIEAADKSWGIRFSLESHFRVLFENGRDQVGRTNGETILRRFRPEFYYCIDNCLYEFDVRLDMDGFGTGNAKNSTNTGGSSIMQRGALHIHLENLNPWMPTFSIGGDVSAASTSTIRQGSGAVGAQSEYDLHTRDNGNNTGRAGYAYVFDWDDRAFWTGRITRFQVSAGSIGEGDDNLSSFKDTKNYNIFLGVEPFSQLKNKWIRGIRIENAAFFCNIDDRPQADNCVDRYRIRDHGDGGRQALFDTGAGTVGAGLHRAHSTGVSWAIGPYTLRTFGSFQRSEDKGGSPGRKKGNSFLIGHDLYLWSPKGFLTGSPNTPGSILIGTHWERVDMSCGISNCAAGGQFSRNRIILREWDLWYFLRPRMSIGGSVLWYDASNLRQGRTQAGENLGVHPVGCSLAECRGRGGDWLAGNLNFRYQF
jgi:hypothetical protein